MNLGSHLVRIAVPWMGTGRETLFQSACDSRAGQESKTLIYKVQRNHDRTIRPHDGDPQNDISPDR